MSRALSRLFVKLNIGIYAVNFAVLFVTMILLFSVTGNLGLFLLPGMLLVALICLVYPDFYNVIGGAFGWQNVTTPQPTQVFDQMGAIVNHAFNQDYSAINSAFPTAMFCVVFCLVLGFFCLWKQNALLQITSSPMDWYKKKSFSTYVYAVLGGIYGVLMCIGAFAVIFAQQKITGGLLTLAWYFALCGIVVVAGVVVLLVERFLTVQAYNAMTEEEQIALCDKQAKYMNKRQRKRQVKRLGKKARVGNGKKSPKEKAKASDASASTQQPDQDATIQTVEPTDLSNQEQ